MEKLTWLTSDTMAFPPSRKALKEPNGLLAVGGNLSPARLIQAYQRGIFPWFEEGQPVLWWTPSPRMVLFPSECHRSRSLKKLLRQNPFKVTVDTVFPDVIAACAAPREGVAGTWITEGMQQAYIELFRLGHAHSVEIWEDGQLVGGLYGVAHGGVFFGESMFSRRPNASKVALVTLAEKLHHGNYRLIDCQMASKHLFSMGAREIDRQEFETILQQQNVDFSSWQHIWAMDDTEGRA